MPLPLLCRLHLRSLWTIGLSEHGWLSPCLFVHKISQSTFGQVDHWSDPVDYWTDPFSHLVKSDDYWSDQSTIGQIHFHICLFVIFLSCFSRQSRKPQMVQVDPPHKGLSYGMRSSIMDSLSRLIPLAVGAFNFVDVWKCIFPNISEKKSEEFQQFS